MLDTKIAVHHGKEYKATITEDRKIYLRSDDPNELKNGFYAYKDIYIKEVNRNELEALFRRRFTALYKGYNCLILDEEGDQILIEIFSISPEDFDKLKMDRATSHASAAKWIPKSEAEIKITETPIDIDNY